MHKRSRIIICAALFCMLGSPLWAAPPKLASADWSVNARHNLVSNPPPSDIVWAFVNSAFGNDLGRLCEFRFADLRHSGNLSLVVSIDAGGTGGCNETELFDKTASGFEDYGFHAFFSADESIQDINHDGNHELVLWGPLAASESRNLGCDAEWPMVFAWTGGTYAEVSSQYKRYYEQHLKDLNEQIATASRPEEAQASPAAESTTIPMLMIAPANGGPAPSPTFIKVPAPAAAAPAETSSDSDIACETIEAARTEQLLGTHSDTTMGAAIKDSESDDAGKRIAAAIIFSYIGSQEAKRDLRTLANDSDPQVHDCANTRSSYGLDPIAYYRQVDEEPVFNTAPANLKH